MRLSITQVARPDYLGPIFVLNKSKGELRGTVVFNVFDEAASQPIPVSIPDTFLAIDLLTRATKDQLVKSQDLRQALNRGLLQIIDETQATEINSRAGARQEYARLRKRAEISEVTQSASFGAASEASVLPSTAPTPATGDEIGSKDLEGIHPRLWGLGEKIRENGEMTIINMMRAVVDELSLRDLRFALGVAKAGNYGKLGRYTNNQIRKKQGKPALKRRKKRARAA